MASINLIVQPRDRLGTAAVRKLRRQGFIPGELYGRGFQNQHVTVSARDFLKVLKQAGETTVIAVDNNGEKAPALIHEVARDPMSDEVIAVDFYRVRLDEKIRAKVPIEFTGESPAVKEGGILIKPVSEIEVEALPDKIPHSFIVDLTALAGIGQSLHVKDIKTVVAVLTDPEAVIATVKEQATEEEAPEAEKLTVESVVVETEEKKKERQEKEGDEGM